MTSQPLEAPLPLMSADEFLAWGEGRPGRWELYDGVVVSQAAERAAHGETKFAVVKALDAALRARRLPCRVMPDGLAVRIDHRTVFEPDALVYCGPRLPASSLFLDHPLVVVEVLSPSTGRDDHGRKFAGSARLDSVKHYLIFDSDEPLVIHHRRRDDGAFLTRILREGTLLLDPPGIEIALAEIYEPRA